MATELERAENELTTVRARIDEITAAFRASTVQGRTVQNHELDTLYARERELMGRVARLGRGGVRVQRVVPL